MSDLVGTQIVGFLTHRLKFKFSQAFLNLQYGISLFPEQTEEKSREDRTKPKESTDKSQPFLDFGEDVLKLEEGSDFSGKIPKIEKKAPPKNGELKNTDTRFCLLYQSAYYAYITSVVLPHLSSK